MEVLRLLFDGSNFLKLCLVIFVALYAISLIVDSFKGKKGDE